MRRPQVVKRISEVLTGKWPSVETILYGSEARGEARPDSDFDLLILLPDEMENFDTQLKIRGDLLEIELDEDVIINANITTKSKWENRPFLTPYYINVMNDGIQISPNPL